MQCFTVSVHQLADKKFDLSASGFSRTEQKDSEIFCSIETCLYEFL